MTSRWRPTFAAALLASLLLACTSTPSRPQPMRGDAVPASAIATISAVNADWLPALIRGDAAALAAPYAEDGLFITTRGEVLRGGKAVQQLYAQRLAGIAHVVRGELVHEGSVRVSDSLVYEWGHGTLTVRKRDGTQSTGGGPYLTVWHREPDGHWRISRNLVL